MEKRKIGSLEVSVVGVGCNNFGGRIDEARTEEVIKAALDQGINFFDTADMYADGKSEELIGRFLVGGGHRSDAIIATKFGNVMPGQGEGAHPKYVRKALEASLKRLRTDYIDLYQQHIPDPDVPIEETLGALDELVKTGKVREIGCSNFSVQQLRDAQVAIALLIRRRETARKAGSSQRCLVMPAAATCCRARGSTGGRSNELKVRC